MSLNSSEQLTKIKIQQKSNSTPVFGFANLYVIVCSATWSLELYRDVLTVSLHQAMTRSEQSTPRDFIIFMKRD